jgi:hypothetical protein
MKLFEFSEYFSNEDACRNAFKEYREKEGVVCPHCGCTHHHWIAKRGGMFQCAKCGYRQSLRANTVMHGSKLPFRYWFIAMHLLTATKHSFSALEMQRQLGHKRYQPIWEMMHKLRSAMGGRDNRYTLNGDVEVDEGFFSSELGDKNTVLKRGAGSQAKTKVVVMAESTLSFPTKGAVKPKSVRHIKMVVVPNLKADTIDKVVTESIGKDAVITSDATKSHVHFKDEFKEVISHVIEPKEIGKVLPWVHIAIANSKSLMRDIYHGVNPYYVQEYLNEFCYKFNRRYFGEDLFERLVSITASNKSTFAHRRYEGEVYMLAA